MHDGIPFPVEWHINFKLKSLQLGFQGRVLLFSSGSELLALGSSGRAEAKVLHDE